MSFQFGTTTAYGQSTAAQTTGPDNAADAFSAALTGLPAGTTIHYRAVATSDFGTQVGADQTLTTQSTPPPPPVPGKASVGRARVSGNDRVGPDHLQGRHELHGVAEAHGDRDVPRAQARRDQCPQGQGHTQDRGPGHRVGDDQGRPHRDGADQPNRAGRKLLAARHKVTAKLTVTQRISGHNRTLSTQKVTFKAPKHRVTHGGH